jgi:tripartite-type tricarboxylate transporter receptor subunit TctC
MKHHFRTRTALLAAALALCAPLAAQAKYPERPITFVVPFGAGSATDQLARAIGQGVTEQSGQTVVIENKPGTRS